MLFYTNLLRCLYTFGYYLAVPGLLLRLWWRSVRHNPEYAARWQERFGQVLRVDNPQVIWVHAVSMGETIAAVPLVKALMARFAQYQIVMTSTTPTGAQQVAKHFGDKVISLYMPYDLPDCITRFLDRVHPSFGIILETELWPNMLVACSRRRIPLMLANARLSARSCRGYGRIAPLAWQMVNSFAVVAAQARIDGERFLALGLDPQRLQIAGNIKFDLQLPPDLAARGQALRAGWGDRPVWVAASTHEGEENIILTALKAVRAKFPAVLLILVPRHPERFAKVGQLCVQSGYSVAKRSQQDPVTTDTHILLGDTMGELMLFYSAADVALVGGSFVMVGGHNLIEPAILGVPVLTGPQLHNFVDISQLLLGAAGARIVADAETLAAAVNELLQNSEKRLEMGHNARQAVIANTGALTKHLTWIEQQLTAITPRVDREAQEPHKGL